MWIFDISRVGGFVGRCRRVYKLYNMRTSKKYKFVLQSRMMDILYEVVYY